MYILSCVYCLPFIVVYALSVKLNSLQSRNLQFNRIQEKNDCALSVLQIYLLIVFMFHFMLNSSFS